jgi:hypothetical protein
MKKIPSNIYLPNEIELAHTLADGLNDQKSLTFYLSCAKKYPKDFLLSTLMDVTAMSEHSVRTTRARIFTKIVTNSIYNTNDHTWD